MHATGFAFPNDGHVLWSLMIVMYPYITGLMFGCFIVSALYLVFGRVLLRPVARLSLVASLGFLIAAPLPLLFHLGRPELALNVLITPNFMSAMAAFGYVYNVCIAIILIMVWLTWRPEIVARAKEGRGLRKLFYWFLALGVLDDSKESFRIDHRVTLVLAGIGIPTACILSGYVGFIFGSVKANYWWSSTLMPVIFLFSAVTSGVAMVIVLYQGLSKLSRRVIDSDCVQALAQWLWLFSIMTITLEILEIITLAYERNEEWLVIEPLLFDAIKTSFWVIQILIGSGIPLILLGIVVVFRRFLSSGLRNSLTFLSSLILLVQVFAMRWNIIIGGQMFSKSLGGFREPYVTQFWEKEGVATAIGIFLIPFIFLAVFSFFFSLFEETPTEPEEEVKESEASEEAIAPA